MLEALVCACQERISRLQPPGVRACNFCKILTRQNPWRVLKIAIVLQTLLYSDSFHHVLMESIDWSGDTMVIIRAVVHSCVVLRQVTA